VTLHTVLLAEGQGIKAKRKWRPSRELSKPFIKSTVRCLTTVTTNIQQSTQHSTELLSWTANAIYLATTSPRRLTCVMSRELSKPLVKSTVWHLTTDTTNIPQSTQHSTELPCWTANAIYLSTTSPRRSRATIDSSVSRRWLCVAGCRMIWSRKIIRPKLYTLSTPFCCTYTRSCTATINQTWRYTSQMTTWAAVS